MPGCGRAAEEAARGGRASLHPCRLKIRPHTALAAVALGCATPPAHTAMAGTLATPSGEPLPGKPEKVSSRGVILRWFRARIMVELRRNETTLTRQRGEECNDSNYCRVIVSAASHGASALFAPSTPRSRGGNCSGSRNSSSSTLPTDTHTPHHEKTDRLRQEECPAFRCAYTLLLTLLLNVILLGRACFILTQVKKR